MTAAETKNARVDAALPPVAAVDAADEARAFAVIALAFATDPMMRWSFPDPNRYFAVVPDFVRAFGTIQEPLPLAAHDRHRERPGVVADLQRGAVIALVHQLVLLAIGRDEALAVLRKLASEARETLMARPG